MCPLCLHIKKCWERLYLKLIQVPTQGRSSREGLDGAEVPMYLSLNSLAVDINLT